jgi:hypothetical protein
MRFSSLETQNMASPLLWVQHQTFIDLVSTEGCTYIAQFLNTLYARPLLAIPQNFPIALYQPDGKTEIKPTATIKSLGDAGKDGDAPLIVKTTAPSIQVSTNRFVLALSNPILQQHLQRY